MVDILLPAPGSIVRHRVTGQQFIVVEGGVLPYSVNYYTGPKMPAFHLADYLDTYDVVYTPGEDE